jgi:hypothetical protein
MRTPWKQLCLVGIFLFIISIYIYKFLKINNNKKVNVYILKVILFIYDMIMLLYTLKELLCPFLYLIYKNVKKKQEILIKK